MRSRSPVGWARYAPDCTIGDRLAALILLAGDGPAAWWLRPAYAETPLRCVFAPCQTTRQLHNRARPTAVSRFVTMEHALSR